MVFFSNHSDRCMLCRQMKRERHTGHPIPNVNRRVLVRIGYNDIQNRVSQFSWEHHHSGRYWSGQDKRWSDVEPRCDVRIKLSGGLQILGEFDRISSPVNVTLSVWYLLHGRAIIEVKGVEPILRLLAKCEREMAVANLQVGVAIHQWFDVPGNPNSRGTMHNLPVLVSIDRSSDEQILALIYVFQQGTPRRIAESLRRGKDNEFRRTKMLDLIFGNHVRRQMSRIYKRPHRSPLSL